MGPDGKPDWETIEAVDRARLVQDLAGLFAGESVHLRKFDFQAHDGYDATEKTVLPPGGVKCPSRDGVVKAIREMFR